MIRGILRLFVLSYSFVCCLFWICCSSAVWWTLKISTSWFNLIHLLFDDAIEIKGILPKYQSNDNLFKLNKLNLLWKRRINMKHWEKSSLLLAQHHHLTNLLRNLGRTRKRPSHRLKRGRFRVRELWMSTFKFYRYLESCKLQLYIQWDLKSQF